VEGLCQWLFLLILPCPNHFGRRQGEAPAEPEGAGKWRGTGSAGASPYLEHGFTRWSAFLRFAKDLGLEGGLF